jgi:hypothetical protein
MYPGNKALAWCVPGSLPLRSMSAMQKCGACARARWTCSAMPVAEAVPLCCKHSTMIRRREMQVVGSCIGCMEEGGLCSFSSSAPLSHVTQPEVEVPAQTSTHPNALYCFFSRNIRRRLGRCREQRVCFGHATSCGAPQNSPLQSHSNTLECQSWLLCSRGAPMQAASFQCTRFCAQ